MIKCFKRNSWLLLVALPLSLGIHVIVISLPSPFARPGKVATSPAYEQPAAVNTTAQPDTRV